MEKLTVEKAKKIAKEHFSKIEDKEQAEMKLIHSKTVAEAALIIARDRKVDREILQIAGWLHDIGQAIEVDNHAEHSLKLLKNYEVSEKLKDCILNHGNNGKPKTEEGKIIQIADKVSVLDKEMTKFMFRNNPGKIKEDYFSFFKMLAEKAIEMLGKVE